MDFGRFQRAMESTSVGSRPLTGWRARGLGLSVQVNNSRYLPGPSSLGTASGSGSFAEMELATPRSTVTSCGTPRQCMISFLVNDTNEGTEAEAKGKRLERELPSMAQQVVDSASPIESPRDVVNEIYTVKQGEETKFGCPICNRLFRVKRDLRHHIKCVHEKCRPFSCDLCDKKFSIKPNLKRHVRTVHEKMRPYHCDQCDKAFGLKENFEKHVRMVHERQRPLKCSHCTQDFTARCSLQRHVARNHPEHATVVL